MQHVPVWRQHLPPWLTELVREYGSAMRALSLVIGLGLVGCRATAPAPACPKIETVAAPTIPAEDDQLRRWLAIRAAPEMAPPAGTTTEALVPELVEYLGSLDPVRRDDIAYSVLTQWMRGGTLPDDGVRSLMTQLLANLDGDLTETDGVFRRSFSVLVLGEVVRRHTKQPVLTKQEVATLVTATAAYAKRETDLRGHTGVTGWAHAAAHTGDLVWRLAQVPEVDAGQRSLLLEATASFMTRPHGQILASGEDGRLAVGVLAVVHGDIGTIAIDAWLSQLAAPLLVTPTAQFDANLFAQQRNARNLLFTLFVQLTVASEKTATEQHLLDGIRTLIAG